MSDQQSQQLIAALITLALLIFTGILVALDRLPSEALSMVLVAVILYWLPSPLNRKGG